MRPLCPCLNSKKPMKKVPGAPPRALGQCPSFQMVSPPLVWRETCIGKADKVLFYSQG
ncbi:unnamed protein product [Staurois parvus]|uniref:Uncharacterized protein n=1 Tax=Staurois parvus TaxID=386267 RepID=A0ABN9C5I1_9NEOB|nr:unnamed protein product [Staurois parvus]